MVISTPSIPFFILPTMGSCSSTMDLPKLLRWGPLSLSFFTSQLGFFCF
uniref:Alpha-galactosidase n=1 Tax=Rhizophora mucronata TaxID=61149 RepID=A0A2P2MG50_RHIMU